MERTRLDPMMREWLQVLSRRTDARVAAIARVTLELYAVLSYTPPCAAEDGYQVYLRLIDVLKKLSNRQHVNDQEIQGIELEAVWSARVARLKRILERGPT